MVLHPSIDAVFSPFSCTGLACQWRELSYGSVGELSWYSSLYCRAKSSSKATGAKLSSLAGHNVKGAPYLAPPRGPSHPVQPVHLYRHGATSIWERIKQIVIPPFKDVKIAYLHLSIIQTHICVHLNEEAFQSQLCINTASRQHISALLNCLEGKA